MSESKESVFRFVTIRSPKSDNSKKSKKRAFLYFKETGPSEFFISIEKARKENASKEKILAIAAKFKDSSAFIDNISDLAFDIRPFANWIDANIDKPLKSFDVDKEIKNIYNRDLNEIINSIEFKESYTALADTILCSCINNQGIKRANDLTVGALRFMSLLSEIYSDESLRTSASTVGRIVRNYKLIIPEFVNLSKIPTEKKKGVKKDDGQIKAAEKKEKNKNLKELSEKMEIAYRELSRIAADDSYRLHAAVDASKIDPKIASLEKRIIELTLANQQLEKSIKPDVKDLGQKEIPSISLDAMIPIEESEFILSEKAVEGLKEETKEILTYFGIDSKMVLPEKVLPLIENEMNYIDTQMVSEFSHKKKLVFYGVTLDEKKFRNSFMMGQKDSKESMAEISEDLLSRCKFEAGIGDLLIVEQELKAYELADFAHVENVLTGEKRLRTHRRLNIREEYSEIETEEEVTKERDLQSTERSEMQIEAEKIVRSQFELDAGMQISGSYGGIINFSSSLDIGFSRTTEEAERKAASYAREVTERTSERIMERVREKQQKRVIEEIEETNTHDIDNDTGNHVRGIYRWLNKIYDARIVNYGQRMMFEFVIPEPAAYFLYAMIENPPQDYIIIEPELPTYNGQPLKPSNLTRRNCDNYISLYNVTNAPTPPKKYVTVSYFDSQDGGNKEENNYADYTRAGKIETPSGYEYQSIGARVNLDYTGLLTRLYDEGKWVWGGDGKIRIAGKEFGKRGSEYQSFEITNCGDISFTARFVSVFSFAFGIDLRCELTHVGEKKWQQNMYDAIIDAYTQQRIEYEEKLAAMALQKGIPILGRNPLENRKIERDELKKIVIMMLMQSPKITFNSFYPHEEPLINMEKACENGSKIRFFENAFEWQNMTYVFYPYFWGRIPRWISALHMTDPDPDFAAFLKAGAARVQVPVRPGFKEAVAYCCQNDGEIWNGGNDIPLIDDDLYVPIVDEITDKMDEFDNGLPYPEEDPKTWEVTVPTSLVVVQNLEEIPEIRDVLTNTPINILSDA